MTTPYPPQVFGGARVTTHEFCRLLKARGHEVAVLCQIAHGDRLWLKNRLRSRLTGSKFPEDRSQDYSVYRGWQPVAGVSEVARRFAPDVAVANAGFTGSVVHAFVKNGVPAIAQVSTVEFDRMGAPFPQSPQVAYTANSEFTAGRIREALDQDCTVIPPLVIPESYTGCEGGDSVLHVNPRRLKGIDITLGLAERRPDIPFHIVEAWGSSEETHHHRDRAASLPNVTWHDSVSDMRPLYRRARLVIAPSRWPEAWGRVATEAQVSGTPVLASNRGGLPEAVGPGGMLLDPDAGLDAWERALSKLWDDHARYDVLSSAARAHAARPEIQPEILVARFEDVLAQHCRAATRRI
ncbi:glycosyltransferase [Spiribacter halobius]|uniref:Glycosyl transferase family 1 n=1 Tax=Sediminicurvatus halobius TaxID=2182432 RepID=A0A2U2MY30_9GAMM|nr:glycosyltransferase [Spiribacter halobius]PWG61693.1 glycosyl transferase family 1 [Spiribacter halobius]UEX77317.1 glycosyltransferase [Spiribacter halobius]